MASRQFIKSIAANIAFWTTETKELADDMVATVDAERENIFRAVKFGLRFPQTSAATAELALQSFLLIERRGYWREWMAILEQLLATLGNENIALKFRLLKELGQLQRFERQLEAAVESHQAALAIAQQLDDQEMVAQAKFNLSADYRQKRQYGEAKQHGQKALEHFTAQENKRWMAITLNTLGLIAQAQGNLGLSEERLVQAVSLWRKVAEPTELARSLNNLALTLQQKGNFKQSMRCYHEAATLLAPTASEFDKSLIQISLGTLYFQQKQWAEAEAAFRQANSPYLQSSSQFYYRALIAQNLGNVLLTQKRFGEAEGHLRLAIKLWRQMDDNLMLANSLGTLGQTLAAQGQGEKAQHFLASAITLLAPYRADNSLARELLKEFEADLGSRQDK